jgi:hypothetical protein
MSKFLSFETTNNGTVLFPIADGCVMNIIDRETLFITNGLIDIMFAGTNMSQSLIDSINSAQVQAFQSSWREVVSVVSIPFRTTIDKIIFEQDGLGPGPIFSETCDYQITVSEAAANPVKIVYYIDGVQLLTTVPIGDSVILNEIDCFPEPAIDPKQSPAPNPEDVDIVDATKSGIFN